MPFRYRTPDLVAYLNGEAGLTTRSDVFQLGLVLAELSTGRNPLRPCADFSDPVALDPLRAVPGVSLSRSIADVIQRMLVLDPQAREPASRFLELWEGIFQNAVRHAHALEGRAIW